MTKLKRSHKIALISSIIVTAVCFTLLIGATFAWFTDSEASARNKIITGNLDVGMNHWDADS